jgi:hypothetical protein
MDTPAAEVKPENELQILVKGASDTVTLKDKTGKDHVLQALDLSDIIEYEEKMGQSILDNARTLRMKDIAYLLYLSLRKEGLSFEEVIARKYKITERHIYVLFNLGFLASSATFLLDILRISGFDVKGGKDEKSDPTKAPQT